MAGHKKADDAEPKAKRDHRQEITDRVIAQIEAGTAPWQKTWAGGERNMPYNIVSDKSYRGGNIMTLLLEQRGDPRWMSRKQAAEKGYVLKNDQYKKGTVIEYWDFSKGRQGAIKTIDGQGAPKPPEPNKLPEVGDAKPAEVVESDRSVSDDSEEESVKAGRGRRAPRVFYHEVFNAEQFDGVPPIERVEQTWEISERADAFFAAQGVEYIHGGSEAFYNNSKPDKVFLPKPEFFVSQAAYYETKAHETAHSTGHDSHWKATGRPSRELGLNSFGTPGYAKEELRVEIATMFISSELGIARGTDNNAAYIASWIQVLKNDKNEIFRASMDSQVIADMTFARERKYNLELESAKAPATVVTVEARVSQLVEKLVSAETLSGEYGDVVVSALQKVPIEILDVLAQHGMSVVALSEGQVYTDVSPFLKESVAGDLTYAARADFLMNPAAGIFVVPDKTLYLREVSVPTIIHELGHAFDAALGLRSGVDGYVSFSNPALADEYNNARVFINSFSAGGKDEWFAEAFRNALQIEGSSSVAVPGVSAERVVEVAPVFSAYLAETRVQLLREMQERDRAAGIFVGSPEVEAPAAADELAPPKLPVYALTDSDVLDQRERYGFAQQITVLGASEDGERVLGRNGGQSVLSVARETFAETPSVGETFALDRDAAGTDRARPLERTLALER